LKYSSLSPKPNARSALQICVDGWIWNITESGLNQSAEANPSILIFIAVVICTADYIILFVIPAGYFVYNGSQFVFLLDQNNYIASREKKSFYGV